MRSHIVALAVALTIGALELQAQQPECGVPAKLDDGWAVGKQEDAGLDGARLCGIAERLKAANANVHAVVIVRGGKLVFEQYFAGFDEPWGGTAGRSEFDANTLHDLRSVTKSIISVLFGIALDRKLITNLDEPVMKYFPEYAEVKSPGWDKVTLRHLLKMSSGLQWDENLPWNDKNDEWHLVNDADPLRYVFQKPFAFAQDTFFTYNGGGTDLLGKVIEKASRARIDAFANEVLFKPLGIAEWQLKDYRNGKQATAAGLRLRPRDAAKIGQLVLNKGAWAGRRIVSTEWIVESIKPRLQATNMFRRLLADCFGCIGPSNVKVVVSVSGWPPCRGRQVIGSTTDQALNAVDLPRMNHLMNHLRHRSRISNPRASRRRRRFRRKGLARIDP